MTEHKGEKVDTAGVEWETRVAAAKDAACSCSERYRAVFADRHKSDCRAPAVLAALVGSPSESWFREEYERAKARNESLPPQAGMVVTGPAFSSRNRPEGNQS